jgi:hypothetical protein
MAEIYGTLWLWESLSQWEEAALAYLVLLVVVVHLGVLLADLPLLLDPPGPNREIWVVAVLLLVSLGLGVLLTTGIRPISAWKLIGAIYGPIGNSLFATSPG